MYVNPLRCGITKILENPKEDLSLSYKFKVKLKAKLQKSLYSKFPNPTDYSWLGTPYNAHSLLFFSHYNLLYLNKLITELPQRREYKNLLNWKPRKNEGIKIKRCNYNFYKMIEYIAKRNVKQGTIFSPEETYVVSYKNSVPFFRSYVDIKNILDLCNGKNTIDRIITLLIDKYADKHSGLSYVFGRYIILIKSLIDYDIIC